MNIVECHFKFFNEYKNSIKNATGENNVTKKEKWRIHPD